MTKTKIIIAGIGGVGGFFGGLLAERYEGDEKIEINFVARGSHLKEIQDHGLIVIQAENQFTARPTIATDKPIEIGTANLIILSTKSYDLEGVIQQLRPCVDSNTIFLPLLNGVDNRQKIQSIYPDNIVLDGCVYIVSRLKQAGVIENSGNIQSMYFGLDNYSGDNLFEIERLLKEANIEAVLSQDISEIIWEKFIFLSPIATATAYYDQCVGQILSSAEPLETTKSLIEEVIQLAHAKGINISEDISEKTLNKLKALPFETTSSMHSDFKQRKANTELQTLTGYVIEECQKHGIATPFYSKLYTYLNKKSSL